jgi:hypothetical protein
MLNMAQGAQSFLKLARFMRVVALIIFVFSLVLACLLAVASFVVGLIPSNSFPSTSSTDAFHFDFGSPLDVAVNVAAGLSYKAIILAFCLGIAPLCVWCAAFFFHVKRILSSVSSGRPFSAASSRSLRSLAVNVGVYPFFIWASTGFLMAVFKAFSVQAPDFKFEYDFTYLVFSGLLLVLAGIFRYGEELQVEADATV